MLYALNNPNTSRMKAKLLVVLIFLMSITFQGFGQKFLEMMDNPNENFYDVVREAEAYFQKHGTARGSGYKAFMRWKYLMQDQIDENGNRLDPHKNWEEYEQFQAVYRRSRIAATTTGNWTELGPKSWNRTSAWNPGIGRITCISVDPKNHNVIYIGSPGGGCWKTTTGGNSWTTTTDNLPVMDIASVQVDPINSNIVYLGTSGGGLLKSLNAGATWTPFTSGIPSGAVIRRILIDPNNNQTVLVATSSGIYRSTNGGTSWTQSISGSFNDLEFKPDNTNSIYACGNTFFKSTNNGVNFTQVTSGLTTSGRSFISVTPANPNYVYMVQARGSEFGVLYRSTDSGTNFSARVTGNPASGTNYFGYSPAGTDAGGQAGYDMAMCVSPTNAEEVYIAGIIIWKTTNGGSSFTAMTEWIYPNSRGYTHPDMHVLEYVGTNIYSGSDGGIYKSTNQGGDWTDLSTGLGIRQFYRIGGSKTNAAMVTGGSQDNGSSILKSTGWIDWLGADGMEGIIDHTNPNIVYGTTQNGGLNKSVDGGNSRAGISTPAGSGNWVTPWVMDPVNSATLYLGYNEIWKTTNGGSSWTKISTFGYTSGVDALEVAPSNSNYLYASKGSTIWVTKNGGANWTNISAGIGANINYITVHPDNPEKVAVSTSGTNKVFTSSNGGTNWTNMSGGLPNIGANCVIYQKGAQDGLYVGMNVGIYYRDNTLGAWVPFMTNLPKVSVRELEVHQGSGKLRAATHGRGLWQSDLYGNDGNTAPTVSITSPGNGAAFTIPATVTINATATDADGSIARVEFFIGAQKIGEDVSIPYSFAWNPTIGGTYLITAKATDNLGSSTISGAISVTINPRAANVIVYQDCNFDIKGYAVSLNVGNYTTSQMAAAGLKDNDASSLKVQAGYEVVLYELDNFQGASQVFTGDVGCLVNNSINDWASSMVVRAIVVNQAPVVSITAPANNALFAAPASLTITANATDSDGTVTKVEFFNGTQKLGEDLTNPYSFAWSGVASGTYQLTAKATDNGGLVTTSGVVTIVVNQAPVVSITAPANAATFTAPATVAITANASDSDGTISKVEFFNGTVKLGEDLTSPYSFDWNSVAAGTYQLTAKATDNRAVVTTSTVVSITVNPEVIVLRDPENPANTINGLDYKYYEGTYSVLPNFSALTAAETGNTANYDLSVRNRDDLFAFSFTGFVNIPSDGEYTFYTSSDDGSRLYIGTTLVVDNDGLHGTLEKSGKIGLKAGKHAVTVNFFEQGGGEVLTVSYSSSTIAKQLVPNAALFRINVAPTVSITSPVNNATFTAPANITINANAADTDGSVAKVQFFNGSTLLGEDATSPYSFAWNNVAEGTYQLTAKVTDNGGLVTTSSVISVTVNPGVVLRDPENPTTTAAGLDYKYYEGLYSVLPDFNSLTPVKTGTVANYDISVRNRGDQFAFMYNGFINVPTDGIYTFYTSSDDGSKLYIGNTQVVNNDGLHGTQERSATIGLKAGKHAITVTFFEQGGGEVLTVSYSGPGIAKQLVPSTSLFRIPTTNSAPIVSISGPANNTSFVAPATIAITANASDNDGTISKVEFFNGATSLGEDATSPYSFSWANVAAGTYQISAKATDNGGSVTTSASVIVIVTQPATCSNPTGLSAASITTTSATLNWAAQPGAVGYLVWWRVVGTAWTNNVTVTTNSTGVSGLTAGTDYEFTVRTNCSTLSSEFATPYGAFKTATPNTAPSVSISSPTNGQNFVTPASLTIVANATDADGSVSKVEFFNGVTKIGEDLTSPYSLTYTINAAGSYTITAKATDNSGAITTSAAVSVNVTATTSDACATTPQFVENGGYVAGSIVKNAGSKYQCKPYPYSGWCNGISWAYAPGTGDYWSDAWTLVGPCTTSSAPATRQTSDAPEMIAAPHPFIDETTISVTSGDRILSVKIMDMRGKEVTAIGNSGLEQIKVGKGLQPGIYIIQVTTDKTTIVTNIIKAE
jgi:hypothetical protein